MLSSLPGRTRGAEKLIIALWAGEHRKVIGRVLVPAHRAAGHRARLRASGAMLTQGLKVEENHSYWILAGVLAVSVLAGFGVLWLVRLGGL